MQIISGKFKGLRICTPKNVNISPTSSVVRRAIFDYLRDAVVGKSVLDLYAGSGALGIEALSRGAARAVFVEKDPDCFKSIKHNIAILKDVNAQVIGMDVFMALNFLKRDKFDIILIDPPYKDKVVKSVLLEISEYDIVKENPLLFAEHHKKEIIADSVGLFKLVKKKSYGETIISIFSK